MMKLSWISVGLVVACVLVVLAVATYNKPADERIVELAQRSLDAQANQNRALIEQSRQVTEASKELVAADAQARREMAVLSRELQAERTTVGKQRDRLEAERRLIAVERRRASVISAVITQTGILLACLAPLLLAWLVLRTAKDDAVNDQVLTELLLEDAASEQPKLFGQPPGPAALPHLAEGQEEEN